MARGVRKAQVRAAEAAARWYLRQHYRKRQDPGMPAMYCDRARVGEFAVSPAALRRGDPAALFRVLIATTMFQRRQDVQIMRVLREMPPADAREVSSQTTLLALVEHSPCDLLKANSTLLAECDLGKHPISRIGRCSARPRVACHLKRHTVVLKRYGHFGKVPTSAALMLREAGVDDLAGLRHRALKEHADPGDRARALEEGLSGAWRISQKIACMFLSAVATPDLSWSSAPWRRGLDWTRFVVVDSNVDLFLGAIGYDGIGTYDARRSFIQQLAAEIDLRTLDPRVKHAYNPRLVQQAMYAFMSASNRRSIEADCMHVEGACLRCPRDVRTRCPVEHRVPGNN